MNPVSVTVAANFGPDAMPDLREEQREAEVAQHEVRRQRNRPVHAAGAAQVAEDQRDDQHAGQADGDLADAGDRDLDRADQEAERHAEADGDVAELRGALDRVAEELAQRRRSRRDARACRCGRRTRARGRGAAGCRRRRDGRARRSTPCSPGRSRSPSARPTTRGPRREHADVVEVAAILGDAAGRRFAQHACAPARALSLLVATTSSTSSSASTIVSATRARSGAAVASRRCCTPAGSAAIASPSVLAEDDRDCASRSREAPCRFRRAPRPSASGT